MRINGVEVTKPNYVLYNPVTLEIMIASSDYFPVTGKEDYSDYDLYLNAILIQVDTRDELISLTKGLGLVSTKDEYQYLVNQAPSTTQISGVLLAAGWVGTTQTITVNGMTAITPVVISPDSNRIDADNYRDADILPIAQGANSVTFECVTVPLVDITVNMILL